jgi:hypothetical protein
MRSNYLTSQLGLWDTSYPRTQKLVIFKMCIWIILLLYSHFSMISICFQNWEYKLLTFSSTNDKIHTLEIPSIRVYCYDILTILYTITDTVNYYIVTLFKFTLTNICHMCSSYFSVYHQLFYIIISESLLHIQKMSKCNCVAKWNELIHLTFLPISKSNCPSDISTKGLASFCTGFPTNKAHFFVWLTSLNDGSTGSSTYCLSDHLIHSKCYVI